MTDLKRYLENVRRHLRLDPHLEWAIIRELYTHLEERTQELMNRGLPEPDALKEAEQEFGNPRSVAHQMYQIHSKGSWAQALLAAMPHLLLAFLFAFHLWHNWTWGLIALITMLCITAYGWWHGKSAWIFPWLGYSVTTMAVVALFSASVLGQVVSFMAGRGPGPSLWVSLAVLAYIPLALRILWGILINSIRRDWIYVLLMILPLPALAALFLALQRNGGIIAYNSEPLQSTDPWLALSFLILGATTALFVRLSQRPQRIAVSLVAGVLVLVMVVNSSLGGVTYLVMIGVALLTLGFFVSPAWLERKIGHGEPRANLDADIWPEHYLGRS
ncbi:MAG: hypothetical protein HY669_03550 [Chloroflexi bacterium]|nr:hypothetical protein [Chloroflexota bacterium]